MKKGKGMNALEETKFLLKKYDISASKKLGQNFLIDDEVIENIVTASNVCKDDLVIEIGPGLGSLTSRLLEKAGKVIAIELDSRMIKILQDRFILYPQLILINDDILKIDLRDLIDKNKNNLKNVRIVANLPYYITTPIIMKLLEEKINIDTISVMVQKEVADRIIAIPGEKNSGAITYSVYYYAEAVEVCFVSKACFIPIPEVDSKVIKLNIREKPVVTVKEEEKLFKVIKASFMQRRKTLLNGLLNGGMIKTKEEGKELLKKLGLPENVRGETLRIEEFAKIADNI